MAQFFDVNSTPAGTAIKTLLDLSQLQRQDATTKNLESDSRMREMQTASLGQEMAAQQQLLSQQAEFRKAVAAKMQQDQTTTNQPTTSVSADQAAAAADPNVQMAKQLDQWRQDRAQYAQLEWLGTKSGGMTAQQAIDMRTRINELDQRIQRGTEDQIKAKTAKSTAVGNVLAGIDSAPALDAALNHMDTQFPGANGAPGAGTALRSKLPTDTDGNLVWNDATKAVINPIIDQTVGASVRQRQEAADNRNRNAEASLALREQALQQKAAQDALVYSLRREGLNDKADRIEAQNKLDQFKMDQAIEKLKNPVDPLAKERDIKALAAAGPATDKQLAMVNNMITADPDFADNQAW